jgi:hypothetical protein
LRGGRVPPFLPAFTTDPVRELSGDRHHHETTSACELHRVPRCFERFRPAHPCALSRHRGPHGPHTLPRADARVRRDAIWFDYISDAKALTPDLVAKFDAAVLDGSVTNNSAVLLLGAKLTKLDFSVEEPKWSDDDSLKSVREKLLAAAGPNRVAEWEKFLAQREPEKREASPTVANYERRAQAVTLQHPFSVKGSKERTQVAPDLRMDLFAAEPDIAKPIFMAWDERGRCWVAETRDYPHGAKPDGMGDDTIKICEDTEGDGKADKFTVFADKLNIPASIVPRGMRAMTAKRINTEDKCHTITPNVRQVDVFGGFTAAAGSAFIYSDKLPPRLQGKAMVCEPTMKVISLMDVRRDGAGYTAKDGFNLVASSDEWMSPVLPRPRVWPPRRGLDRGGGRLHQRLANDGEHQRAARRARRRLLRRRAARGTAAHRGGAETRRGGCEARREHFLQARRCVHPLSLVERAGEHGRPRARWNRDARHARMHPREFARAEQGAREGLRAIQDLADAADGRHLQPAGTGGRAGVLADAEAVKHAARTSRSTNSES